MHTVRYYSLSKATGKASDEHAACMSRWVRKSSDAAHREKCVSTAQEYKRALERELAYLLKRPSPPTVDLRIALIKDYLDLVDKDLTLLAEH